VQGNCSEESPENGAEGIACWFEDMIKFRHTANINLGKNYRTATDEANRY